MSSSPRKEERSDYSNRRHENGRYWSGIEMTDDPWAYADPCASRPHTDEDSNTSITRNSVDDDQSDRERTRRRSRDRHADRKSHRRHKEKKKSRKRRSRRRSSRSSDSSISSRSRSRSRSHSRHRHNHKSSSSRRYYRSKSRSDSDYSRDAYSHNSDMERSRIHSDRTSDHLHTPSETLMIRGLALHLTETDIHDDIQHCGIPVKDIRLIRNRETGNSRGFAFVEFDSVEDAVKYMEIKKGVVIYHEQYESSVIFSVSKSSLERSSTSVLTDWFCLKCSAHNFKRREVCYRCNASKSESGICDFGEEITKYATNTLLLKNLDTLTTEDKILQAFELRSDLRSIPTKNVKVARETGTNLSRGICFVEMNTVSDAVRLYDSLIQTTLEVDERKLSVAYCKPPQQNVALNSAAAAALAAAQWSISSTKPSNTSESEIQRLAEYSASLYAKTPEEKTSYMAYYLDYYRKQHSKGELLPTGNASIQTPATLSGLAQATSTASGSGQPNRSASPDMNRLQFDEASSYYYDPVTLLYYDGNTQYFYDSVRMEYLYWDSAKREYVNVVGSKIDTSAEKTDEKSSRPKIKVSKSLLKDTLKQAVEFNDKKNKADKSTKGETIQSSSSKTFTSLPVARVDKPLVAHTSVKLPKSTEVFEKSSESEDDSTKLKSTQDFRDLEKMACILCKRQFPKLEVLEKHIKLSSLHQTNLTKLTKAELLNAAATSSYSAYRDRAKERRKHFGPEIVEVNNCLKEVYMQVKIEDEKIMTPEASSGGEAIREDNIGNRMLQKMGWKSGKGLGKNETGVVDIIQSEMRTSYAGLGMPSSVAIQQPPTGGGDRYSKARNVTLARYRELEEKTNTT